MTEKFKQALRRNDNSIISSDSQTLEHGNHDDYATRVEDNSGPRQHRNDNDSCNCHHYGNLTYSKNIPMLQSAITWH